MTKRYMRRRLREIVDEEELAEVRSVCIRNPASRRKASAPHTLLLTYLLVQRKTLKLAKQWAAWRKEQMDKVRQPV